MLGAVIGCDLRYGQDQERIAHLQRRFSAWDDAHDAMAAVRIASNKRASSGCTMTTNMDPPPSNRLVASNEKYVLESGDIHVQVERTLYQMHAYHLRRATPFFDGVLQLHEDRIVPGTTGSTSALPLVLDAINAEEFEALLWFFYESTYFWTHKIDGARAKTWESVLLVAKRYSMFIVARVACCALSHCPDALDDTRKIALHAQYAYDNKRSQVTGLGLVNDHQSRARGRSVYCSPAMRLYYMPLIQQLRRCLRERDSRLP
ncbi:hypothetical protein BD626DRAFT_273746 [Schizophyllum amplum]|uniref:BTB domain-containing protein n=1 Tax=Schizophyllum amplum TaxID=97359 RepID=A0A550CFK7_9AGAR|nr:hypothetical protein BD626DRAFT_273746 [Auriculariopsis ampla]